MTTNLAATKVEKEVELKVPQEYKQPLFKRLLPYVAWQLVALLAVEATLAFAGLGEEELFKLDPEIGTVHMTNKSITWRKEGYARSYLHANGLRDCYGRVTGGDWNAPFQDRRGPVSPCDRPHRRR